LAFPTVLSRTNSNDTTGTSHTVSLGTLSVGDLYIVQFVQDYVSGDAAESFPAGWTQIASNNAAGAVRQAWRYRVAQSGDPSSITVTTASSEATISRVWRIQSGTFTGNPAGPSTQANSGAGTPSTSPDPPSYTASWGADDNLWIVGNGNDGARTTSGFDANLTNTFSGTTSSTANGVGLGCGEREFNSATWDPSTFTISASDDWLAQTIVVRGVGSIPNKIIPVNFSVKRASFY
jgi:hypothetical protein